eukprot:TRINITY_DN4491_c5_g1_i1.p1 TRINITY_DN4491_c5_g1~~TRINITY_DN4491_c5_g1_i1.p1  ORF type:complete len:846 (+),score=202.84 TRINITY_DN4491_c5_g1_i1:43-2538(+)
MNPSWGGYPSYGPSFGNVNMNMNMAAMQYPVHGTGGTSPAPSPAHGVKEKKEKRRRSKSREKKSKKKKKERKEMVPDVEAYMKFLEDVAGWNELKKKNLIINTFAMLSDEKRDDVRRALALKPKGEHPEVAIPKTKRKTNFICTLNTVERYECKSARLAEGSYIFAIREEWGFFSLYKAGKPTTAERVLSPFISSSSSKNLMSWDELIEAPPVFTLVLLEISELSFSNQEFIIRISTLNSDRPLKLKIPPKEYPAATAAIKACHVASRPYGATTHPGLGKFFIDGEQFFPELANELLQAEKEVLMAAWWMSPYIYLKRKKGDCTIDQNCRLDNLLHKKAYEGVKIYILLYQEIGRATALTSLHTKTYLESLHPNIKVVRHRGPLQFTHHQKFTVIDWKVLFIGGLDPCYGRFDTQEHPLYDAGDGGELFPGLDYRNPVLLADDAVTQTKTPFVSALNKRTTHRLPWHDLHLRLKGRLAYVVGLNFVQRWHHHVKRTTENIFITPDVRVLYDKKNLQKIEDHRDTVKATVCRSLGLWSGNSGAPEKSIHAKYIELIDSAQSYIYIENQYFISGVYGPEITNGVAQALVNRIVKSWKDQLSFKVFLLLQPHGEGDPVTDQFIRSILYFQNQTLLRMVAMLTKQLGSQEEVDNYLFVGCLQQYGHSPENKKATFSPIYIHSKFIIVDDTRFILGSANINDRSFLGDRDSELAVLIDGSPSAHSVKELRVRLWTEHLDVPDDRVENPTSREVWDLIWSTSTKNTHAYTKVFPAAPNSEVTTLEEAQRLQTKPPNDDSLLKSITGHLVLYPMAWLSSAPPTMIAQAAGTMAAGMFE